MASKKTRKPSLSKRVARIEHRFGLDIPGRVSGVSLSRSLLSEESKPGTTSGVGWCFGVGHMSGVKEFFYGGTMEETVDKCEAWIEKNKALLHLVE